MSQHQALFMSSGPQLLIVDSADFDGTNDYMTRGAGLTGAADSKSGIFSSWYRIDAGDGGARILLQSSTSLGGSTVRFDVRSAEANTISISGVNAAGALILQLDSDTAYTAAATWLHVLASWDLANAVAHLYINDVEDLAAGATLTDDTVDHTTGDWAVGAIPSGAGKLNGCLAELYFAPGQYLDFSVVANRRKFISGSRKPVWLGANGSSPTGTAPIVYQRVADGAAVATFATNLGTGGDFAITGTLETGSTSPSD